MADRLPCVNPRCRRTDAIEKHPGHDCIICQKCFKALPASVRTEYKHLRRRERTTERRIARRAKTDYPTTPAVAAWIRKRLRERASRNYDAIWGFFRPNDKPEGLDAFLEEFGL